MLIKNAKLKGYDSLMDIAVKDGVFTEISGDISGGDSDVIDADGHLVIAPFIEPHIHLDTTLTAGEPSWNMSGTLFEGIQRWAERKESLTIEDVKKRAKTVLKWHIANGVQFTRTHVDITDPDLVALKAMIEVREEMKQFITVQIVAFPQEGIFSYPNGEQLMRSALDMGADVIGAIPHFEFTREYGVQSIDYIFELAREYDKQIDVHCDEIDDEQSRFIEVLATRALELGIGDKVTASHTTAMHSYNNAYAYKLFRLLKMSGVSFIANPLVNIHLQGRFDSYPKRRGVTRVKEMLEADINVCFGHDDVFDPWYPLGTGNMLQVLHMGLHVCQIMGYEQIDSSLELISTNSAKTLGVQDIHGIETGKPASFIILDADSGYDAVRRQCKVLYSIKDGKVISKTQPADTEIYTDTTEKITYQK